MNTILLTIAFAVFFIGTVLTNKNLDNSKIVDDKKNGSEALTNKEVDSDNVLGDENDRVNEYNENQVLTPVPTLKPFPTLVTLIPKKPTEIPQKSSSKIDFQYPGSSLIRNSNNYLELTTGDNPKVVTDWYKAKIKAMGMSVTSFVSTTTNSNVLNRLSAADELEEINIEIIKSSSEEVVRVTINFSAGNV